MHARTVRGVTSFSDAEALVAASCLRLRSSLTCATNDSFSPLTVSISCISFTKLASMVM